MHRKQEISTIHCGCGKKFKETYQAKHEISGAHKQWLSKHSKEQVNTSSETISKDGIIRTLSCNFQNIISAKSLEENGIKWGKNGVGNRLFPSHNYSVIYSNGKTKTYSENIDDSLDNNSNLVLSFLSSLNKTKSSGIIGIFIHSLKEKKISQRPIHTDIKKICKSSLCVVCGTSSDVLPDHKNDLYNDERVLSIKTQNKDDFQTLCRHCNLRKRQVAKKEREDHKIYSAKNIPQFQSYNFPFPWEYHNYDESNPKCKEHSYWYDPIEFNRKLSIYMMLRPVLQLLKK